MQSLRDTARIIFEQALADCSVSQAMARHVRVQDGKLHLGEEAFDLGDLRHLRILAAGKAANAMLSALLEIFPLTANCDVAGELIAPAPPSSLPRGFQYFAGGHPLPNEASFAGAKAALAMLHDLSGTGDTVCLFLLSGGASAMMEMPLDPAISLADTAVFHRVLVACGASITEINCVRKHFSAVKGGRLAMAAKNVRCHSLLISDVPMGHEDALGSGPTLPDSSTVEQCRQILARYHLLPLFPAAVRQFFASPALPETPKHTGLNKKVSVLLHTNDLAQAAVQRAEALGWTAIVDNTCDEWDYRDAANYLLGRLKALQRQHERVCLISAGEVVVQLPANGVGAPVGLGGRNQQFALYAATLLKLTSVGEVEDMPTVVLSAGSDGIDGNSPAAGSVLDGTIVGDQSSAAQAALENFNTYPFLAERNATIVTGPTGNNLRDLRLLLSQRRD